MQGLFLTHERVPQAWITPMNECKLSEVFGYDCM